MEDNVLRDCTTPATRLSCSLEPVPGRTQHPSSKLHSYNAGERPEEIVKSDYDSSDTNCRFERVDSDKSDPDHRQGAADNPDNPEWEDRGRSESGAETSDPGTLSEQTELFPINRERAKYIEVSQ